MANKKILLIGADGQVGQELQQTLITRGEIVAVGRQTLDLIQSERIRQFIREFKPDIIVNAAAYTAVDQAETEIELAYQINAIAPTIIAEETQKLGATLLHISTDYVFDGRKSTPYTEVDDPNPLSVYGQSKLAGEQGIKNNCEQYIIFRTAWVYGTYGKSNFVKTMLRLGKEKEELRVVCDQVGSPTWSRDIAQAITHLLDHCEIKEKVGIYHFTNSGVASWYDFAVMIFEEAKNLGFPLQVQRIIPITTLDYPTSAKRPAYSILANQKISGILGTHPPDWRNSLRKMLQQLYGL